MAWNKRKDVLYQLILASTLYVVLCQGVAHAQNQYQGIPIPPYEFYEALLTTSQSTDSESSRNLSHMVSILNPLFESIQTNLDQDAKSAILSAIDKKLPAYKAVIRLIYLDMRLNFKIVKTEVTAQVIKVEVDL